MKDQGCRVPWCHGEPNGRPLCPKHRTRKRRHGSPIMAETECWMCGQTYMRDLNYRADRRCPGCLYGSCSNCGTTFKRRKRQDREPWYCSEECQLGDVDSWHQPVEITDTRTCIVCGSDFAMCRRGSRVFCSDECEDRGKRGECENCGDELPTDRWWLRKYCRECAAEIEEQHYGPWNRRRRRRMQETEPEDHPVVRSEIFKRDGWICQICHRPINQEVEWPHPKSGVVDHIVPLLKGGVHAPWNVQAAHMKCNAEKGDGAAGSQMRIAI